MSDEDTSKMAMPIYAYGRVPLPDHIVPKFEPGEYVVVMRSKLAPVLQGMTGKVRHAFGFNRIVWYHITAENYGPKVKNALGAGKNVRAWMPGNIHYAPGSELMRVSDAPDEAVYQENRTA